MINGYIEAFERKREDSDGASMGSVLEFTSLLRQRDMLLARDKSRRVLLQKLRKETQEERIALEVKGSATLSLAVVPFHSRIFRSPP